MKKIDYAERLEMKINIPSLLTALQKNQAMLLIFALVKRVEQNGKKSILA